MIPGAGEIRKAAEVLVMDDRPIKSRLAAAGLHFWSGMFFQNDWPRSLQRQAEQLQESLLRYGPIVDTVARMDERQAGDVAQDLLLFAVEMEVANRGELHSIDADSRPSARKQTAK